MTAFFLHEWVQSCEEMSQGLSQIATVAPTWLFFCQVKRFQIKEFDFHLVINLLNKAYMLSFCISKLLISAS